MSEFKVIGAGFGRTGTKSLQEALNQLGFKCYHMESVFNNGRNDLGRFWSPFAHGGTIDLDQLFDGYTAAVDFPTCLLYREMLEKYPDAKVVLTVRDPERWYASVMQTIYFTRQMFHEDYYPLNKFFAAASRVCSPFLYKFADFTNNAIWHNTFFAHDERVNSLQGPEGKALAVRRFNEWVDEVKANVPPEKLLVFQVSDGWGPLCEFLEVHVPEGDFPRVNSTAEFRKNIAFLKRIFYGLPLLAVGAVAGGTYVARQYGLI